MYHISDCKMYLRCPVLFEKSRNTVGILHEPFARKEDQMSQLVMQKLKIQSYFMGQKGDDPIRAKDALGHVEWLVKARFEAQGLRVKVPFLKRQENGYILFFLYIGPYPKESDFAYYALLYEVLRQNHIMIIDAKVIHLNKAYVRDGELDVDQLFTISDVLYSEKHKPTLPLFEALQHHSYDLSELIDQMNTPHYDQPKRTSKCVHPYVCPFYSECFAHEQSLPDDSVLTLMHSQHKYALYQSDVTHLQQLKPEHIEGSRMQYAQIMAAKNGGLYLDMFSLGAMFSYVQYPITFLDFEWECHAIPPYSQMHPFDVLPFEYAMVILNQDGTIEKKVFLGMDDDRQSFIEHLNRDLPKQGTIFAYNAEYAEKRRLEELAIAFPSFADQIQKMIERLLDLQALFSSGNCYHIKMRGSYSLKSVMQCIENSAYQTLNIQEGMQAVYAYRKLSLKETSDPQKIIDDLHAYCLMDAYSMYQIFLWLQGLFEKQKRSIIKTDIEGI